MSKWWDIECASHCDVTSIFKAEHRVINTFDQTTRITYERYEVRLLWREDDVRLSNNFYSAMGAAQVLERRLQKDDTLRKRYQEKLTLSARLNKWNWTMPEASFSGICHIILSSTLISQKKFNETEKYKGVVALNDNLLYEPNLLQSLIGIVFRFSDHQIPLLADIEAMFLQFVVPSGDNWCLGFLWCEGSEQMIEVNEYARHVFGTKSSPSCQSCPAKLLNSNHH